jgi:hypothetical protein
LSLAFAVTDTVPLTVTPFAGAVIETVGGVVSVDELLTVTLTLALFAVLPEVSVAVAERLCASLLVFVLSQANEYGAVVSAAPKFAPSNLNCTLATATLSAAFAEIVSVPLTVAPFAGVVKETVGGVVSPAVANVMSGLEAFALLASVDRTRKW